MAKSAKPTTLVGPFAAIMVVASMLVAMQWFRKGPSSVGHAAVPPAFAYAEQTLAGALIQAKSQNRPVIAFATASWCGPCQVFKRDALADAGVTQSVLAAGVPAYIDVDVDQDGAATLKIFSIPALVALKDGKEVGRMEGVRSASEVTAWLQSVR